VNPTSLLTYDAQKASEAAFHGRPLDPTWSTHAQDIYRSILAVTNGRAILDDGVTSSFGRSLLGTTFHWGNVSRSIDRLQIGEVFRPVILAGTL
jgi:hypothetical protein